MTPAINFRYDQFPFPFHAVLISHHGKRIQEDFIFPCQKNQLHRMFSITKSFTALAVCALAADQRIQLSDPIIRYFPDYTPADPHPWLAEMTIQDLLDMRTCHSATTYKINPSENWVRSFFVTPPDHRSGQIFKYDTSAAHTLASLVRRLSGLGVLDYLRGVYLDALGFSESARILKDPFQEEMGGTGLLATVDDILINAEFLMSLYQGTWRSRYGSVISESYPESFFERYAELIKTCVSLRSPTLHEGKTLDECQGYGSQFWRIRNGFMMYGMGGQYAAFYPDEDLIIVTAADTQSLQGATQIILDEMNRIDTLLKKENGSIAESVSFPQRPVEYGDSEKLSNALSLLSGSYQFLENRQGFLSCSISAKEVSLVHKSCIYRFPVSLSEPAEITDPRYHQRLFIETSGLSDGSLYQYIEIYDEYLGSIRLLFHGDGNKLTVYMRKIEESLFLEMNGFLEAVRIS